MDLGLKKSKTKWGSDHLTPLFATTTIFDYHFSLHRISTHVFVKSFFVRSNNRKIDPEPRAFSVKWLASDFTIGLKNQPNSRPFENDIDKCHFFVVIASFNEKINCNKLFLKRSRIHFSHFKIAWSRIHFSQFT